MKNNTNNNRQIKLSPSRLGLFKNCRRCFWMEIMQGVKRPAGIFPSLPSGMDKVLKIYFDSFREKGELPPDIKDKLDGKLFDDMEKMDVWRNNFRGLQHLDEESGILLRGAVDDMFVSSDGSFIPIDFKTRGFPLKEDTAGHYQHQMDLYCFLLAKNGMKVGDCAVLVFYYPKAVNGEGRFIFECEFVRVQTSIANGEQMFKEAIKILQGPEPECDPECKWCNWK